MTEEVVDWVKFGIHLGVQHHILLIIEKGYGGKITDCKMKLLQHWLDNDSVPSWEKVATALMKINRGVLAVEGKCVSVHPILLRVCKSEGEVISVGVHV